MAKNDFKLEGFDDLVKYFKKLGKVPMKTVTPAARKGGRMLLVATRAAAPVETGDLKRGLILKVEKSKTRGKKVYQVVFSANMNDVFVKTSKTGKRAYYPSSMEYGYVTRSGGYVPGYRFMRKTAESMEAQIKNEMVKVISKEIDKLR